MLSELWTKANAPNLQSGSLVVLNRADAAMPEHESPLIEHLSQKGITASTCLQHLIAATFRMLVD